MRAERLAWTDRPKNVEAGRRLIHRSSVRVLARGMTGWAQVNGSRGSCHTPDDVRERVRLDMDYVNRASVWFDFWIALKTPPCLLGDREKSR